MNPNIQDLVRFQVLDISLLFVSGVCFLLISITTNFESVDENQQNTENTPKWNESACGSFRVKADFVTSSSSSSPPPNSRGTLLGATSTGITANILPHNTPLGHPHPAYPCENVWRRSCATCPCHEALKHDVADKKRRPSVRGRHRAELLVGARPNVEIVDESRWNDDA